MPQKFVGYAITTMFGQQVLQRTRTTTVYRIHTGRLFYKLIEIEKILQREVNKVSVINTGIIKHYPAEINYFQNKIESKLMDVLVHNYSDSKDCKKERLSIIAFHIV
ncbi:MAG: hypothetical protein E6Q89_06455 [Bacteroidia bacterium]|nr:MAG: hypothetical protein E6Q89_06455 [Bacteroidia bacterium]